MPLLDIYKNCIKKYVVFDGRARRKEYWYFFLFNFLVTLALTIPAVLFYYYGEQTAFSIFVSVIVLYNLFVLLPSLSVMVRRLHDGGKSGAWVFILLIPTIGAVIMFIWLIEEGHQGSNLYGPDPKDPAPFPVQVTCMSGKIAGKTVSGVKIYIGRDSGSCQLVYPEQELGVSRKHCVVRSKNNLIELVDLNSSNGTFLSNGTRLTPNVPVILKSGDSFYIGNPMNMISVKMD